MTTKVLTAARTAGLSKLVTLTQALLVLLAIALFSAAAKAAPFVYVVTLAAHGPQFRERTADPLFRRIVRRPACE